MMKRKLCNLQYISVFDNTIFRQLTVRFSKKDKELFVKKFYDVLFASNYENSLKKKKRQKAAKEAILAKEWPA